MTDAIGQRSSRRPDSINGGQDFTSGLWIFMKLTLKLACVTAVNIQHIVDLTCLLLAENTGRSQDHAVRSHNLPELQKNGPMVQIASEPSQRLSFFSEQLVICAMLYIFENITPYLRSTTTGQAARLELTATKEL